MTWVYIEQDGSSFTVKSNSERPPNAINAKLANSKATDLINHTRTINKGSLTSGNVEELINAMDLAHMLILAGR